MSALALLAAAAAPAAAQASAISILDLPADLAEPMKSNGTASLPFKVEFVGDGVSCPQASSITVTLTVKSGSLPPGVTATVEPAEVSITVPQGIHQAPPDGLPLPVSPFRGEASGTISVAAGEILDNGTGAVGVTADYSGGTPEGCQGALPGASGEGATNLTSQAPPPPPPVTVADEKKGIPAPGFALVAVGVLAAGRVLGRRDG